ncbi:MAG TPA: HRDC domain-containing protein, partial [Roseiarcus sp.]|nr:HRDC domain-containing protein [Roseiarcus sp.]
DRLGISDEGMKVLRGEKTFALREDIAGRKKRRDRFAAEPAAGPSASANATTLAALKALRMDLARRQNVPAYVVFADRTLIDMAARRPKTLQELAAVHGVGEAKLKKYGETFLAAIRAAESG